MRKNKAHSPIEHEKPEIHEEIGIFVLKVYHESKASIQVL